MTRFVHSFSLSASVTWFLAPHAADSEACSRSHANEVVVLRVPGPHELSVLPLAASRRVTQPLTSRVQLCCGGLEGCHGVSRLLHTIWMRSSVTWQVCCVHEVMLLGEWLNTSVTTTASSRVLPPRRICSLTGCQSCHSRLVPLPAVSEDCASTLEKHGSLSTGNRKRVASIASPSLTLKHRNLQFNTSAWCRHPDACSGNFGQKYLTEAIEITRLLRGSYVDESSAYFV